MLSFAYKYKNAINDLTDIREMKLRNYEIGEAEWEIVRQLCDVLKVSERYNEFPVRCSEYPM
jgi:hypothetical protein